MLRTYLIMTWSIFDYDWFIFNNYAQFARIIFSIIIPPSEPAPVIICITYYIIVGDSGIVPIVIKENMKEGRNHL